MTAAYIGAAGRAALMRGTSLDSDIYIGVDRLFPLWGISNLGAAPWAIFDAREATWSGSNFVSSPNNGSWGGSWGIKTGTPTKAAADIGGNNAMALNASGIFISSLLANMPAGNRVCAYVSKRTGPPPNAIGMMIGQAAQQPGWGIYDQINTTATFSNGHTVHAGDSGMAGWPTGSSTFTTDIGVTPPADDGQYHITICAEGTETYWRQDGVALSPIFHSEAVLEAVSGDLVIGTSYSNQHFKGNTIWDAVMPGQTLDDIIRLEGLLSWGLAGNGSLLVDVAHPYKYAPPTI